MTKITSALHWHKVDGVYFYSRLVWLSEREYDHCCIHETRGIQGANLVRPAQLPSSLFPQWHGEVGASLNIGVTPGIAQACLTFVTTPGQCRTCTETFAGLTRG